MNNNANNRPVQYFSLPYFGYQSEKLKKKSNFQNFLANMFLMLIQK